jgi:hypothetical protein
MQHLDALDGRGMSEEIRALRELRSVLGESLPEHLLALYRKAKKAGTRASCVTNSIPYAQRSDAAIELGLLALLDRSKAVRFEACALLAYSQRISLLNELRDLLPNIEVDTKNDLIAALDAIESRNHHYFMDRDHSGMITWNVE